jgi:hypothetical protein
MDWWKMRPGPARAAAKAAYEATFPNPERKPKYTRPRIRPDKGGIALIERDGRRGYLGERGGFHPFNNEDERAIARKLAMRCCPPIPDYLTPIVDDNGGLCVVGALTGRRYPLLDATRKLLRISLRIAENSELIAAKQGIENGILLPSAD